VIRLALTDREIGIVVAALQYVLQFGGNPFANHPKPRIASLARKLERARARKNLTHKKV
jgi:hypothetical protein